MRSTLSTFTKHTMGLVRRRTSQPPTFSLRGFPSLKQWTCNHILDLLDLRFPLWLHGDSIAKKTIESRAA